MPLTIGTPYISFFGRMSFGNNNTISTDIIFPFAHTTIFPVVIYSRKAIYLPTKCSDMEIDIRYCVKEISEPIDVLRAVEITLVNWAKIQAKEAEFEITQGDQALDLPDHFRTKIVQRGKPIHGLKIPAEIVLHEIYFTT